MNRTNRIARNLSAQEIGTERPQTFNEPREGKRPNDDARRILNVNTPIANKFVSCSLQVVLSITDQSLGTSEPTFRFLGNALPALTIINVARYLGKLQPLNSN